MKKSFAAFVTVLCAGILGGCATTTIPVSFLYSPSEAARGGTGGIFLKASTAELPRKMSDSIRYVIGHQKNSDGTVTGEIVSQYSAEQMVLDAFSRELSVAGYSVRSGLIMPQRVDKGVSLKSVTVEVEERGIVPKADVTGTVKISLDLWKGGRKIKTLAYEVHNSDVAMINNRSRVASEVVEKALHEVMAQATPDIVAALEPKPMD